MADKRCPSCSETKSLTDYYIRKNGRPQSHCKACLGIQSAAWGKANREKCAEAKRKWRERNADYSLNKHLLDRYGITLVEREAMRVAQGNRCAICRRHEDDLPRRKGEVAVLHVDHDHSTGVVRRLLCFTCNLLIANCRESPEILRAAITYLEEHANVAAA